MSEMDRSLQTFQHRSRRGICTFCVSGCWCGPSSRLVGSQCKLPSAPAWIQTVKHYIAQVMHALGHMLPNNITIHEVRAHTGNPWNELADAVAKWAARNYQGHRAVPWNLCMISAGNHKSPGGSDCDTSHLLSKRPFRSFTTRPFGNLFLPQRRCTLMMPQRVTAYSKWFQNCHI